jgi:ABC-2 type transport system ATP-binding protein
MIEVKGLSKKIRNKKVLDDIQLTVPKGSIYGVIGANGAGKTTLIRHMVGAYRPNMGYVELEGERVYENALTKEKLVYIPDEFPMTFGNRIADIEKLYRQLYPSFNTERYQKLIKRFDQNELENFSTFSKGMKKQVMFILALSIQPDYLIMDEPFDGLDPQIRKVVWDILIEDVASREMTIFISSHHLYELDMMCDHIALLHHGKLVFEKNLEDLKNNYHKYQLVIPKETDINELKQSLNIVEHQHLGRIHTMIMEGDREEIDALINQYQPIVNECLPVKLEEIFMFTLGGANDEIKKILVE